MITWLTISQCLLAYFVARTVSREWEKDHKFGAVNRMIGAATLIVATLVPAMYAVGWLLLPAWGFGVIPFGCMRF